jgi:hypothetical protein
LEEEEMAGLKKQTTSLKLYESDDKNGETVLVWAENVEQARELTNNYAVSEFKPPDTPQLTEYCFRY